MTEKKPKPGFLDWLLGPEPEDSTAEEKKEPVRLQPALRQIGIVACPICDHEIAVYLTRTNRPFINCGFCSVRIFYNGRESMRLLKKRMEVVEDEE